MRLYVWSGVLFRVHCIFCAKISATVSQFSLFKVAKYNETDFPRRFFLDLIAQQFPTILTTACYFANYIK